MCVYILFIGFITKSSWENQLQQPLNYMLNWLRTNIAHIFRANSIHRIYLVLLLSHSHGCSISVVIWAARSNILTIRVFFFFSFCRFWCMSLPFNILANLLFQVDFIKCRMYVYVCIFRSVKHKPVQSFCSSFSRLIDTRSMHLYHSLI